MSDKKIISPETLKGRDHLAFLSLAEQQTNQRTLVSLDELDADCEVIGTSMCILYQAATCYRNCSGGPHVLESLIGRAYNLCCSAYILILRGFYDEAMNLIRSLGEIANLLMLTSGQGTEALEWLNADKKERIKNFGPAAIRKRLNQIGKPLVATDSWYEEFCERFTHVTPQTRPNQHDQSITGIAGGLFQKEGLDKSVGELSTISGSLALLIAHAFKFNDLWEALTQTVENAGSTEE